MKARVFLLLATSTDILFYNGLELLERVKDEFNMYVVPKETLMRGIENQSIGCCRL